jgi:endonuclease-3
MSDQSEAIDQKLQATWPDAACELDAATPWQLLVAVVLSAQAADARVNAVMANLNEHLLDVYAYADLEPETLAKLCKQVPLAKQKSERIIQAAHWLIQHHAGEVPMEPQTLQAIPGVGAKSAAVIAGNAFGVPAIAADRHVMRLCFRLGWCDQEAEKPAIKAMAERLPPHRWVRACHQMIRLGRRDCRPFNPWCSRCPLADYCPKHGVEQHR